MPETRATSYHCDLALIDGRIEEHVAITVAEGRFTSVRPDAARDPAATRLDGLTIPGLANAHSHAFHRALRSRTQADRGSFWTWRDIMYTAAERLDPDNYFRLARATFAEMTMAGMTVVGEFHYVHHQPDGSPYDDPNAMTKALLAAASEVGIRMTLLDTLYLHGGLGDGGYQPVSGVQRRYCDASAEDWATRLDSLQVTPDQKIGAAIHSVRAVDPLAMKLVAEWAESTGASVHAHVSEQPAENEQCIAAHARTPTAVMHDCGVLTSRFTAVHATHLTASDVGLLADAGSFVCLCPTTERDLADGIGPSTELAAASIPMTLGSDSHAVIDHFEECRAVELDERLRSQRRGRHSSAELLDMATASGHAGLGWADAGSIRPGHRADLVTIDLTSVRTAGSTPATSLATAVFAATAGDVSSVIIDGHHVVGEHRHRHIDAAHELASVIHDLMDT